MIKALEPKISKNKLDIEQRMFDGSIVLVEQVPHELIGKVIDDWPGHYEIVIYEYKKRWSVSFLDIFIGSLSSRNQALRIGKKLVQSYIQGGYDR